MKMIGMGGIVFRPQRHREQIARTLVKTPQEFLLRPSCIPMRFHADETAILKAETRWRSQEYSAAA